MCSGLYSNEYWVGGKKKKETDMRIGETLSTVLDTSDLQLKVAALYFLTNTPTPVKPLLVSKIFFVLQCCVSFCCTAKCICHALPLSPPSQPLSHPSRPWPNTELSSLCYTAGFASFLFHAWECTHVSPTLPTHPTPPCLPPPCHVCS